MKVTYSVVVDVQWLFSQEHLYEKWGMKKKRNGEASIESGKQIGTEKG
jgi:hypothetical protein